ncbi:MAG: CDP-diacylglycerol--glycerol-3-phosphate 3-phosphatidyltransferase, partial [Alphaproteobacteria bacterium MarineAlpha2_Bin1]
MFLNIPNILTFSRIIMIPIIILLSLFENTNLNFLIFFIFIYCGITDFLDGFIARKKDQITLIGKLMDPIADKILTVSVLLVLIYVGIIDDLLFIAAFLIIFREFLISGLREFLSSFNQALPVNKLGKIKTMIQFISLGMLLLAYASNIKIIFHIGSLFLWLTALLT